MIEINHRDIETFSKFFIYAKSAFLLRFQKIIHIWYLILGIVCLVELPRFTLAG